jgi:hypothetical protein
MAKSGKKKSGFHKEISSILKGVPIPQGVRNWRPPDKSDTDRADDSLSSVMSNVSSVFKGVAVPGAKRAGEPSPAPNEDLDGVTVPERIPHKEPILGVQQYEENSSQSISPEAETTQGPASEGPATVEKAANAVDSERTAESAQPVSKAPQPAQSSLMKKLAQSEELKDIGISSPLDSAEPEVAIASSNETTVSDKAGDSAKQPSESKQTSQGSLIKRLAQSDESGNEEDSDSKADIPVPTIPKRESPFNRRPKNDGKPETSPALTAQNEHPLADQLANAVDDGGFLQQIKEKLIPSEEEGGRAKDRLMVMLVPILAIVMIFTFRHVLQKSPDQTSAAKKKDEKVVAAAMSSEEIEWKIPEPLPIMTRDPLQLPQQNETENPDEDADQMNTAQDTVTTAAKIRDGIINVRDIVYSEQKASALIGDRIVYAGSKIDDVTIVRIDRDSVELESNGETWIQRVRN